MVVEGDLTEVMQAINSYSRCVEWKIDDTIGDIRCMLDEMVKWKAQHVRRGTNWMLFLVTTLWSQSIAESDLVV